MTDILDPPIDYPFAIVIRFYWMLEGDAIPQGMACPMCSDPECKGPFLIGREAQINAGHLPREQHIKQMMDELTTEMADLFPGGRPATRDEVTNYIAMKNVATTLGSEVAEKRYPMPDGPTRH